MKFAVGRCPCGQRSSGQRAVWADVLWADVPDSVSTLVSILFQLFNRRMLFDSCCFVFVVPYFGKQINYWIIVFHLCFNIVSTLK